MTTAPSSSSDPGQHLSRQFQQAADLVANLPPAQAAPEMHTLYGLYKQATDGDHDTYQGAVGREEHDNPDGPAGLSQAQWDAWSQFKGVSKEDAMRRYVQEAAHLTNPPTGSGKGDGAGAPPPVTTSPAPAAPATTAPEASAAGAANAGLRGDLRAGTPYGSEEALKEDSDAQRTTPPAAG